MKKCLKVPVFKVISQVVSRENVQGYLIGGYVRDCILDRNLNNRDIDIVVIGDGIEIAKKVAAALEIKRDVTVYRNFGTAMLQYGNYIIEFVGARKESYRKESRKPIVENGTLEDDQNRRDFTINTLAISLNIDTYGDFIDPFNGMDDLQDKTIRTPLDPDQTFSDDPLRMMRAIRFATQLGFRIDEKTYHSIEKNRQRLAIVSMERIMTELNKIILSEKPSIGFRLLNDTGLLAIFFPELDKMKGVDMKEGMAHKDNLLHTIAVLDKISEKTDNLWLRWAALLHDIAKPDTKRFNPDTGWTFHGHEFRGAKMVPGIFKRLKLPLNEKMKYVKKLVLLHLRPIALVQEEVTDSAVRRLLFEAGDDIDDLMLLCEADITSKNERRVKSHLKNFQIVRQKLLEIEEKDAIRNFQPPISGDEIIKTFDLPPSRIIGVIKNAIKEAILEGEIGNNYEEAYEFMLKKAAELGLKKKRQSKH
jgi:poly(A) polymerase